LDNIRDHYLHTFENGIRWVHKQVKHTKIAHCGIMLDIGSRDEKPHELGLAHFWEHMAFKGTVKHNSSYILNRIDSLGGELNAYTTKEKICFHSSLLGKHFEKAVDLLIDITFNSTFPQKEIDKECQVILEEMSMYSDDPEDSIQDDFDSLIFAGNPMGNNILGTKESVSGFMQADFVNFVKNNINTERLIISTVSNHSNAKALKIVEKYLKDLPSIKNDLNRVPALSKPIQHAVVKKPITQAHCMIGRRAYGIHDPKRLKFFMLANLLGGHAMNARLNLSLREKYGLVYTVDAQYTPYIDSGLFGIYFGTEKKHVKKSTELVLAEFKKLRETPLTTSQLKAAKEQLKGQLAMSEENNNGLMLLLAKSTLDLGYVESIDSIFQRIDKVTSADLQEIAQEMFKEEDLCYLTFEPEN
jgi:predicted Zn-dependent peptidase